MKTPVFAFVALAAVLASAQPTNVPLAQHHAVMLRTNTFALVGYGTNIFWSNMALIRAAGVVAPTNAPADGQVPVWSGNAARWADTASVGIGGIKTNAITTNAPAGMTNVVSQIARNAIHNSDLTNVAIVEPNTGLKAYWDDNTFTIQDNLSVLGWISFQDSISGNGMNLTNLNATNLFGYVQRANLGNFANQNVGARFLRNDYTWQIIGGGGDMLAANNLSDLANAAAARTNLGAHNAANLTAGKIPLARLGDNTPSANYILKATSESSATWVPVSPGAGDLLSANNLSDVENIGQSRTNLGAHNAANLTVGKIPIARIGDNSPASNYILRATSDSSASWVLISPGGDLLAANNLSDVAHAGQSRTNLGAHNAFNLTAGLVPAARLSSFNSLTGTTLAVQGQAHLTNATLRGTTLISDPFDAANATNLLHGPIVQPGDGNIVVTPTTNETTGQRTYAVGLSSRIKTNIIGADGWVMQALYVNGLTGCAEPYNDTMLVRKSWGNWVPPLWVNAASGLPPVEIVIWCIAETCQWQLWVRRAGSVVVYTNATFGNPWPYEPDPPLGHWPVAVEYECGNVTAPANLYIGTGHMLNAPRGLLAQLLKFQAGLIVRSNSWEFFDPVLLDEGDAWLLSSNGVLHAIHRYGGNLYTNRLVP